MSPKRSKYNYYEVYGKRAVIFLTGAKGGIATIDAEDLPKIMEYGPWYLSSVGVPVCKVPKTNGLKRQLNRTVTDAEPSVSIQHIDEDKTNCRKKNLLCMVTGHVAHGTNTGVYFETARQKYRASIIIEGKRKTIGRYDTLEEAVAARSEVVKRIDKTNNIYKSGSKWRAYYKSFYLGVFPTKEDAIKAQARAASS